MDGHLAMVYNIASDLLHWFYIATHVKDVDVPGAT